ncbi:hypothetical protein BDV93DRAFT_105101 [Ceratobasidium sp. AG-I]|nr:hypothetical protein BDV93DRAFT_105101 [Ceratobasidium sp. AG-I]
MQVLNEKYAEYLLLYTPHHSLVPALKRSVSGALDSHDLSALNQCYSEHSRSAFAVKQTQGNVPPATYIAYCLPVPSSIHDLNEKYTERSTLYPPGYLPVPACMRGISGAFESYTLSASNDSIRECSRFFLAEKAIFPIFCSFVRGMHHHLTMELYVRSIS